MRRPAFLCALLMTLLSIVLAPPASAADMSAQEHFSRECAHLGGHSSKVGSLSGDKRPVILVHGWNSNSDALSEMHGAIAELAKGKFDFRSFDYRDAADWWPSENQIAQCFAYYARWVSDVYKQAGGDGRVLVVGHSMGGLVPRFASSAEFAGDFALDASVLGGVVTIDTPHRGSDWPFVVRYIAQEKLTAILPNNVPERVSLSAVTCLGFHDKDTPMPTGCAAPPYLPKGVYFSEISGDVTLDVQFLTWSLGPLPLVGDTIVPLESQQGYAGSYGMGKDADTVPNANEILVNSGNAVTCTAGTDAITAQLRRGNFPQQIAGLFGQLLMDIGDQGLNIWVSTRKALGPTDIPEDVMYMKYRLLGVLAETSGAAACGHSTILSNTSAQSYTTVALLEMSKRFVATEVRYIEPVDAEGDPAPGWEGRPGVYAPEFLSCPNASGIAASAGVVGCSGPAMEACWPVAGSSHIARCATLDVATDPDNISGTSSLVYSDSPIPSVDADPNPAPAMIEVKGVGLCSVRGNTAAPVIPENYVAWYQCDGSVLAVATAGADTPFDTSQSQWTIATTLEGANQPVVQRQVTKVWFLRTAPDAPDAEWVFRTTGFGPITFDLTLEQAKKVAADYDAGPTEPTLNDACEITTFTYNGTDFPPFSFQVSSDSATGKVMGFADYGPADTTLKIPTSEWIIAGHSTLGDLKSAYAGFTFESGPSSGDAYAEVYSVSKGGSGIGVLAYSDSLDAPPDDSAVITFLAVGVHPLGLFEETGGC